uniref:Uncharacterized protein n=1 Tax=Nelumbo nucifera TaxID=4432 RepID=A0A822Z326_NELNU|nr:TPA_asm: hypothetical protein HUJ06_013235 [Nelumbo nucifera]
MVKEMERNLLYGSLGNPKVTFKGKGSDVHRHTCNERKNDVELWIVSFVSVKERGRRKTRHYKKQSLGRDLQGVKGRKNGILPEIFTCTGALLNHYRDIEIGTIEGEEEGSALSNHYRDVAVGRRGRRKKGMKKG